jgi:hypothetical protein
MKTPIQELIKQLEDLRDSIPDEDAMYRGGVINSIRLAEGMLEREKGVIQGVLLKGESVARLEILGELINI